MSGAHRKSDTEPEELLGHWSAHQGVSSGGGQRIAPSDEAPNDVYKKPATSPAAAAAAETSTDLSAQPSGQAIAADEHPTSAELLAHPDAPQQSEFSGVEVPDHHLVFRPRTLGTRVFGLLALGLAVAAVAMTVAAFRETNLQNTGIAATLWVLAAIIWAVRAGNSTARLSLNGPLLMVEHRGRREVFDLSSKWTPVEVTGNPRSLNWKVTFQRPELGPYVIDSTMVNPTEFMKVLTFFRDRVQPD